MIDLTINKFSAHNFEFWQVVSYLSKNSACSAFENIERRKYISRRLPQVVIEPLLKEDELDESHSSLSDQFKLSNDCSPLHQTNGSFKQVVL